MLSIGSFSGVAEALLGRQPSCGGRHRLGSGDATGDASSGRMGIVAGPELASAGGAASGCDATGGWPGRSRAAPAGKLS